LIQIIEKSAGWGQNSFYMQSSRNRTAMVTSLETALLMAPEADRAYPIARLAAGITLARWRTFVSQRVAAGSPESGIMVAEDARDYILGLGSFYIADDLSHGPTMVIDNLFALDFMGGRFVTRLLLRRLVRHAGERGLRAVETRLPAVGLNIGGEPNSLLRLLREDGHYVEQVCAVFDLVRNKAAISFLPPPTIRGAAKDD
jgi:hypothetical protein